jgi:DNA-binding TFAR19-related protein (PDSD5 family)
MEDAELEELRRRKMAELQRQRDQQAVAQDHMKQVDDQRASIMRQILTPEALSRRRACRRGPAYSSGPGGADKPPGR